MNTFTINELMQEVRDLADEHPTFIYQAPDATRQCFYSKDRNGTGQAEYGCIFGRALARLGVTVPAWLDRTPIVRALTQMEEFQVTPNTNDKITWCSIVQVQQDVGDTWRHAIKTADKIYL